MNHKRIVTSVFLAVWLAAVGGAVWAAGPAAEGPAAEGPAAGGAKAEGSPTTKARPGEKDFVEKAAAVDMKMIWIGSGSFEMGDRQSASDIARKYGGTEDFSRMASLFIMCRWTVSGLGRRK